MVILVEQQKEYSLKNVNEKSGTRFVYFLLNISTIINKFKT